MFVRMNYKSETVFLFLPTEYGSYVVYQASNQEAAASVLLASLRTIALVDPPEIDYQIRGRVRNFVFCSNNDQRHYHNAFKDTKKMFYIGMPTTDHISHMIDNLLPHVRKESDAYEFMTDDEVKKVLWRRSFLVGNSPRYILGSNVFMRRCHEIKNTVQETSQKLTLSDLGSVFKRQTRFGNANDSTFSSKIFELNSNTSSPKNSWPLMYNLASSVLADIFSAKGGSIFTDERTKELESWVSTLLSAGSVVQLNCKSRGPYLETFKPKAPFVYPESGKTRTDQMYDAIRSLKGDEFVSLRLTDNFPVADLAIGPTEVVNVKGGKVSFSATTVRKFMETLQTRQLTIYVATPTGKINKNILKDNAEGRVEEVDDFTVVLDVEPASDVVITVTFEMFHAGERRTIEEQLKVASVDHKVMMVIIWISLPRVKIKLNLP